MSEINIEDQLQQDTFNFLDVLSERSYPKDEVSIFLDEASAYKLRAVKTAFDNTEDPKKRKEIEKLVKQYQEDVKKSEYVFKLTGVSFDRIEGLIEMAKKKYPVETKTRKTASGGLEQYEVPSEERNEYIGYLTLWIHVEAIVSPDGKVHTSPDEETIIKFLKVAPPSQVNRFTEAISRLQVSSQEFEDAIDDDFLAKL